MKAAPHTSRSTPKQAPAPSSNRTFKTTQHPANRLLTLGVSLGLFLATLLVYAPVYRFGFVNFDDPDYVTDNPHVRSGLTSSGAVWAVTSTEAANWFPATRLSHLIDVEIFGLQPGGHHFTNALLHALATVLLFAFLHAATGGLWRAAFVAILFAAHPLHVESVAWIAERKDVLSAVFWFLALWSYVRRRYWLTLLAFCFGLMSKPMVVTLPFALFLLDIWPLRQPLRSALRVKIPMLALSTVTAAGVYLLQRSSGAVREIAQFPIGLRAENAVVSYAIYIVKMFWPARLAVFYPYPRQLPLWQLALSALLLIGISNCLEWRPATS